MTSEFEDLLLRSIDGALSKVFDKNTMKAVDFYVDRSIALSSPADYARSMQRIFGEAAKVLVDGIIEALCRGAGVERGGFASLEECVASVKAKLVPSSPN